MKFLFLFLLLVVVTTLGICFGSIKEFDPQIIIQLRIPRVLLAILIGGMLSVSGAVYQGILKNPLADPYILGSASGAALGVVIAEFLNLRSFIFSFLFSFLTVITVFFIAKKSKGGTINLILTGLSANIFISGLILFFLQLNRKDSQSVLMFIFGNLAQGEPKTIVFTGLLFLVGFLIIYKISNALNVLTLGEEKAKTLGLNLNKYFLVVVFILSIIVGICVSIAGIVGFVGLVAPHIARIRFSPNYKILLPASFLSGAIFLVASDLISRIIIAPVEVPIGVITSVVGAPFFVYILYKAR